MGTVDPSFPPVTPPPEAGGAASRPVFSVAAAPGRAKLAASLSDPRHFHAKIEAATPAATPIAKACPWSPIAPMPPVVRASVSSSFRLRRRILQKKRKTFSAGDLGGVLRTPTAQHMMVMFFTVKEP